MGFGNADAASSFRLFWLKGKEVTKWWCLWCLRYCWCCWQCCCHETRGGTSCCLPEQAVSGSLESRCIHRTQAQQCQPLPAGCLAGPWRHPSSEWVRVKHTTVTRCKQAGKAENGLTKGRKQRAIESALPGFEDQTQNLPWLKTLWGSSSWLAVPCHTQTFESLLLWRT